MWPLSFWADGFLPFWEPAEGRIVFDLGVNVGPRWGFRKGTFVSYYRQISYWRYTTVKR